MKPKWNTVSTPEQENKPKRIKAILLSLAFVGVTVVSLELTGNINFGKFGANAILESFTGTGADKQVVDNCANMTGDFLTNCMNSQEDKAEESETQSGAVVIVQEMSDDQQSNAEAGSVEDEQSQTEELGELDDLFDESFDIELSDDEVIEQEVSQQQAPGEEEFDIDLDALFGDSLDENTHGSAESAEEDQATYSESGVFDFGENEPENKPEPVKEDLNAYLPKDTKSAEITYFFKENPNKVNPYVLNNIESINASKFEEYEKKLIALQQYELHGAATDQVVGQDSDFEFGIEITSDDEPASTYEEARVSTPERVAEKTWNAQIPSSGLGQEITGVLYKNNGSVPYFMIVNKGQKIYLDTVRNLNSLVGTEITLTYEGTLDSFRILAVNANSKAELAKTGPGILIASTVAMMSIFLSIVVVRRYRLFG